MASLIKETRHFAQEPLGCPLGRITLAGCIRHSRGVPAEKLRLLGSYALVYLASGHGFFETPDVPRREIHAGDLLILFPDIPHAYGPEPGSKRSHWDEIYCVFDGPVFDLWRERGLLRPEAPVLHLEPIESWFRRFEELLSPALPPLERVARLQGLLAALLTHYQRDPAAARDEEWLQRARALLESGIGNPLYIESVAQKIHLSPETFRKKFTRLHGIPPWRYRMIKVIERACALLQAGVESQRGIAERLGFNDEFHFSRRFKQVTGRSPRQFRALVSQPQPYTIPPRRF